MKTWVWFQVCCLTNVQPWAYYFSPLSVFLISAKEIIIFKMLQMAFPHLQSKEVEYQWFHVVQLRPVSQDWLQNNRAHVCLLVTTLLVADEKHPSQTSLRKQGMHELMKLGNLGIVLASCMMGSRGSKDASSIFFSLSPSDFLLYLLTVIHGGEDDQWQASLREKGIPPSQGLSSLCSILTPQLTTVARGARDGLFCLVYPGWPTHPREGSRSEGHYAWQPN